MSWTVWRASIESKCPWPLNCQFIVGYEGRLYEGMRLLWYVISHQLDIDRFQYFSYYLLDPYLDQKESDNEVAIGFLPARIEYLDQLSDDVDYQLALVTGVLVGNVFDWGAAAVAEMMKSSDQFDFHAASTSIQG